MIFDVTVMGSILKWAGVQVASGIVANTAYKTFKDSSLKDSLKGAIGTLFDNDNEFDAFIDAIHNKECSNPFELPKQLEECFTAVTEEPYSIDVEQSIRKWAEDNKSEVEAFIYSLQNVQSAGFNVGSQHAEKIVNIGNSHGTININ